MRRLTLLFPSSRRESRAVRMSPDVLRQRWRRLWLLTILLALAVWATMAVRPPAIPGLGLGLPSPLSIQADRSMTFKSALRTDQARVRAESDPNNIVYVTDPAILIEQRNQLDGLLETVRQLRADPSLSGSALRDRLTSLPNSSLVISSTLAADIAGLADAQWQRVQQTTLDLYDRGMREKNYTIGPQALADLRDRVLPYWAALSLETPERDLALMLSIPFLKTNQVLDDAATQERKQQASAAVEPVMVSILRGESIVRQGDVITPAVQEKLEALGLLQASVNWLRIAGQGVIAALTALLFGLFIGLLRPALWQSERAVPVIYGVFSLTVLAGRLWLPIAGDVPYGFPLAAAIVLLAALFDPALALFAAALMSLLITVLGAGEFALAATLFLASAAAAFAIRRPMRSLAFFLAGAVAAVVTALAQVALSLMVYGGPTAEQLIVTAIISGLNGALTAIVSLSLFSIVGNLAGMVTSFQLMELAHPSQPLLRKLMREAPGTYYHSIAVGNLAEAAAEEVAADALLLRVAAYYHDIGKTVRPYFYTDNQSDRENVHNDLDPYTSAQIIVDHVREGTAMARAARVPSQVVDFIPTHHGTMVIKHFYQLALQRDDVVDIEDFRYPGPKPQTREQGILMLADSVEATVRSKAQHGQILSARDSGGNGRNLPGKQTLEEMVNAIIQERITTGQLDECPLTVSDLAGIRQAFINTLQGIYHPRVEYAPQLVKVS